MKIKTLTIDDSEIELKTDVTWSDDQIIAWLQEARRQLQPDDFEWKDIKSVVLKPDKILSITSKKFAEDKK